MKQLKPGLLLLLITLLNISTLSALQGATDSLKQQLSSILTDTAKVSYLVKKAEENQFKNPALAVECGVKAVYLAKGTSSITHIRESLDKAAKACFYAGLVGEASKFVVERMELVKEKGSLVDQAKAYNDFALIAQWSKGDKAAVINNLEKSLRLFKQDSALRRDTSPIFALVSVYNNLGFIELEQGNYPVAEAHFIQGIAICKKDITIQEDLISLLLNYGNLLIKTKRYPEALKYLEDGLALSDKAGNKVRRSAGLFYMGDWYAQQGDVSSALTYYIQSFEEANSLEMHSHVQAMASKLSELYQKTGNADEALKYLKIAQEAEAKVERWEGAAELEKMELRTKFKTWEAEMQAQRKSQFRLFAIILLCITGLALVSAIRFISTRKKYREVQLKQMDMALATQKLQLEKELLAAELESKDKQLTTEILYKIRRNELIDEVVQKLMVHSRQAKQDTRQVLGDAVKYLQDAADDETWKEFEMRFNKVHTNFYEKLQEYSPTLTLHERRLCAFLKLNMTTKEISALTGQSVRAIELMRGRVRKKLELTNTETSLAEFLGKL